MQIEWNRLLDEVILPNVEKPSRYTGGEWNAVVKDWDQVDLRMCVLYPDTYELGMSNLAIQIVYDLVNRRDDALCERSFTPWPDMEAKLREHQVPLFSLETRRSLSAFDIVGFSLGYEQTYTNVLTCLDLGGIPLSAAERSAEHPFVIAGGNCVFNPEPMAEFFDVFVIGEAEEVLVELLDAVKATRGLSRRERLRRFAQIPGIYVPLFYEPSYDPETGFLIATRPTEPGIPATVVKRVIQNLDEIPYPTKPVVPFMQAVHDRITLEVFRGCTRGCRFCQAGMITRPVRERSLEKLVELSEELVRNTGCDEISLMSLSTADYSRLTELTAQLNERFGEDRIGLSLPSLRVDAFSVDIADEVQKVRKGGITFAPEAGSQRMRDVVSKTVTEEDLFTSARAAFEKGWRKIKLYFMIGLPTETDEDIAGIAHLAHEVLKIGRSMGVSCEIHVGVSTFVPKPHTPFQWYGQDMLEEIKRKQALLRSLVRDRAIKLSLHAADTSFCEGLLSRGDRRLGAVIRRVWEMGARFDGWDEYHDPNLWLEACRQVGVDPHFFANRHRDYDEGLPWDHIDCGVTKRFQMVEDKKARKPVPRIVEDCKTERCFGCAVCWDLNVDIVRAEDLIPLAAL
jgi:radical SAM family uncharacterized protein